MKIHSAFLRYGTNQKKRMDGQTDGHMEEHTDGRTDGWMNGCTDIYDGWINAGMYRCTDNPKNVQHLTMVAEA